MRRTRSSSPGRLALKLRKWGARGYGKAENQFSAENAAKNAFAANANNNLISLCIIQFGPIARTLPEINAACTTSCN
jgi:hypothetical protein